MSTPPNLAATAFWISVGSLEVPSISTEPPKPFLKPAHLLSRATLPTSWLTQRAFLPPAAFIFWPPPTPASNSVWPTWALIPNLAKSSEPEFIDTTGIPAAIAAFTDFPRAAASGKVITIPFGFCETALSISFAISTMSKVPGAVYLHLIFISLQAESTPFLATDQKGSLAWPCETTITSIAKDATDIAAHERKANIVKYIFLIFPSFVVNIN